MQLQPSHSDPRKQLIETNQITHHKSPHSKQSHYLANQTENISDEEIEHRSRQNQCDDSISHSSSQNPLPPYIIRNGETLYILFPKITNTELELVLHPNCQILNCQLTRIPPQPLDLSPYIEIFKNIDLNPITTTFNVHLPFKVSAQQCPPLNFISGEWLGIQFQKAQSDVGHHLGKLNIIK